MRRAGFTLIELMIGLALFSVILAAGIGAFVETRALFFKLKAGEEDAQAAYSALDRIRIDLVRGGRGLTEAMGLGLVRAVETGSNRLTVMSAGETHVLHQDAASGDGRIILDEAGGLKKGDVICLLEGSRGETRTIMSVDGNAILFEGPLGSSYCAGTGRIIAVERVSYYLGNVDRIVRRQAGSASPQPLIEDVEAFLFSYDPASNIAAASLRLMSQKERIHEVRVFPKNAGLSRSR